MKATDYERKLNDLMNNVFIAISGGLDLGDEGYAADVRRRALDAEKALVKLKNEIRKGER